jgi:mannitol/fructose-specific phosphotransferase system IIA component (Ntr-type)
MPLADIFVRTAILDGGPGLGKAELVGSLLEQLAEAGHVPPAEVPAIRQAVLSRERLGPAGVGGGLAVPHARHPAVSRTLGILALCRTPVEYDSLDGEPVDIVALLLAPSHRPGSPLVEVSRWTGGPLNGLDDAEFRRRLRQAASAEEVMEIVQAEGGMTRREWLGCQGPAAMLAFLGTQASDRKLQLFLVAVAERLFAKSGWEELQEAVPAVRDFLEARASSAAFDRARDAIRWGLSEMCESLNLRAEVLWLAIQDRAVAADEVSRVTWRAVEGWQMNVPDLDMTKERAAFATTLRCIFPGPVGPPRLDPVCLVWNDALVTKLAAAIYEERRFVDLPILADALEEGGCTDGELLGHLRGQGPHWRGCFALDLLTGKD